MFSRSFRLLALFLLLPLAAACASRHEDALDSMASGMARMGSQLRDKGETGAAIDFYRRALAADPQNLAAIKGLAGVLEQFGDQTAALDIYKNGVVARPEDGELHRNYGKLLIALDNPSEAKKQFEAALDCDSGDLKARSGLGVALDYLGEHAKAQKQYEKVLDQEPHNLGALNNLAYSFILTRRYDKAVNLLEPQLNNPAATAALRQNLALAYGLSGMDDDAERVAQMDLPPEKVAKNMAYYRRQRAALQVSTTPYAELGTYATEALAVAQIRKLEDKMKKAGGDLKPVVLPEVSSPGGTPRFAVRMMGCSRPDDIARLCQTLAQSGIPCVARGAGD